MLEISVDMCYNKYYLLPRQKRGGGTMDAYNAFMHSLDNYSGCSFLVAGKRLSLLLSDFTAVEEFTLFLRNILPAFNYADEFSRASIPLEQIGDNVRSKLILPRQESVRFAFIVCLLTEIDSGKRDFVLFLREYFDCGDTQKSFEYFCQGNNPSFQGAFPRSLLTFVCKQEFSGEKRKTRRLYRYPFADCP